MTHCPNLIIRISDDCIEVMTNIRSQFIIFASIFIIFTVITSVLAIIIYMIGQYNKQIRKHQIILLLAFGDSLIRVFWFTFCIAEYKTDSTSERILRAMNRLCIYFNYFAIQRHIQAWTQLLVQVSRGSREKAVNIAFIVTKSVFAAYFLFDFIAVFFVGSKTRANKLLGLVLGLLFGLQAITYLIAGSMIMFSLRRYYRCCTCFVIQFLIIAFLFISISGLRMAVFVWDLAKTKPDSEVSIVYFALVSYALPELISISTFVYVAISQAVEVRRVRAEFERTSQMREQEESAQLV